jgi:hypothetical protein
VVIASIYLMGGWIFFKVNYNDYMKIESLKQEGLVAEAVVMEMRHTPTGICPYVEVAAANGEKAVIYGFENPHLKVGDVVPVKYNPENIQIAALSTDIEKYPVSFHRSVFGSAFFCAICCLVAGFTLFSKRFTFQLR